MKIVQQNPLTQDVVSKASILMNKKIIVEVVNSQGCNSEHKVGDIFYFDGLGNLITELCPKRICNHALHAIIPQVFAATELICAGVDPNKMRFKRAACFDVVAGLGA